MNNMSSRSVSSVCFLLVHYFFLGMACRTTVCQKKTRVVTTRSILNTQHTTHNIHHTTTDYRDTLATTTLPIVSRINLRIFFLSRSRGEYTRFGLSRAHSHPDRCRCRCLVVQAANENDSQLYYYYIDYVRHNPNLRPSDSRRTPARRRQRRRQRQWTTDTARR